LKLSVPTWHPLLLVSTFLIIPVY